MDGGNDLLVVSIVLLEFFSSVLLLTFTSFTRRKSHSISPRRRKSRSPTTRRRKSRSPTPRRHKRQRSRSTTVSPINRSRSPSLGSTERKNAIEKLKKEEEEEEKKRNLLERYAL
uniref:Uncharacterized protein n=1 Tax=Nelumbo nucifera TaxID=4432 RepID=A0A822XW81_NELNU|nr:TPA_asm: hypothetical protein HUJ06_026052 [Nelumbo nucifera]